jgi:hypothetical protein
MTNWRHWELTVMDSSKTETFVYPFDSILALSNFLQEHVTNKEKRDNSFGGTTFADTLDILARGGYDPASAGNIDATQIDTAKFPARESTMPIPQNAMVGYRPNVAAYLANAPECMVKQGHTNVIDRRVRILVASTSSCGIDDDTMKARGAAIMGVLEYLQDIGYSVELSVGFYMSRDNGGADSLQVPLVVKHYQDTFDPTVLGFLLTNPSFPRKALFGAVDCLARVLPDNEMVNDIAHGCMGYPMTEQMNEIDGYDIAFEAMHLSDRWTRDNSAGKALAKVYSWLEGQA